jgi:hypothetical protein
MSDSWVEVLQFIAYTLMVMDVFYMVILPVNDFQPH